MIKGYKIRLFPTQEQEEKLWNHVHTARFIWNWGLNLQMERFQNGEKHLSGFDMMKLLTPLKKAPDMIWLKSVSNTTLQIVMRDLDEAYQRFFAIKPARYSKKKIKTGKKLTPYQLDGHPRFKSKKNNDFKFPVRYENTYFKNSCVNIEKVGKIKYQTNFNFPEGRGNIKVLNPRIKFINNKWILSFAIECENQAQNLTNKSLGIDLGIKTTVVASFDGEKIEYQNINKSKRMRNLEKKKKRIQRVISRKYRTNGNYEKTKNIFKYENILRKIESKLSNIRKNYTHQTTHELVSLLPKRVIMENLNVIGMMKNRHLSKAIQQQCFGEFIRQMKYKCEWNGIEFIQVGRFYPSSKTCSCCGKIKSDLKISDRVFKCECGFEIDRDFNAALNLERYDMPNRGQSA